MIPERPTTGPGRLIVIVGPDGSGKSSLADVLAQWAQVGRPVRRFHHRFRTLPGRPAAKEPTTEPHRLPPYPRWLTTLKIGYLFVDHLLGLLCHRTFISRGGWVLLERGWWDLVVDPSRYRLDRRVRLAAWLGRLLPEPDATLILDAPPAVIAARKSELPVEELTRQLALWRILGAELRRSVLIDATQPAPVVLRSIMQRLETPSDPVVSVFEARSAWTGLPSLGRGRWIVPGSPRRSARSALTLFQPMTVTGRVGWECLRALIAVGGLSILPRRDLPGVREDVVRLIPPGGSLSIREGTRPGRSVAMVMDDHGLPIAVAKMADDPESRAALAREVQTVQRMSALLRPPLTAPRLLSASDGLAVFEPVSWRPRFRPWELPVDLAIGIGHLHQVRMRADAVTGPGHGDFAPWNVMRTDDGWVLIDWENALDEAPPFDDVLHYLVQGHALLGRPSATTMIAALRGAGKLGHMLSEYAEVVHRPKSELPSAFLDYLARSSADLTRDRPDHVRGLAARNRLRERLGSRR